MRYKQHKQHRLAGYDYSQVGACFITICLRDRCRDFGEIVDAQVKLSTIGQVVKQFLLEIPQRFPKAVVDKWVIMPNHVYMILVLGHDEDGQVKEGGSNSGSGNAPRRVPTGLTNSPNFIRPTSIHLLIRNLVSSIINHFKGNVKRYCNKHEMEYFCWQSRYHDHIIRNQESLDRIRLYIQDNPAQ